jgi:hypothetical protein
MVLRRITVLGTLMCMTSSAMNVKSLVTDTIYAFKLGSSQR